MKIIFSSSENNGSGSILDSRFGRAAGFLLFDEALGTWSWIDNASNADAPGGAGVHASQTVLASGAEIYIGAELGPKAMTVLSKSPIQLFIGVPGASVQENYTLYREGKLTRM